MNAMTIGTWEGGGTVFIYIQSTLHFVRFFLCCIKVHIFVECCMDAE
jgi:hypothetical protein